MGTDNHVYATYGGLPCFEHGIWDGSVKKGRILDR